MPDAASREREAPARIRVRARPRRDLIMAILLFAEFPQEMSCRISVPMAQYRWGCFPD
jgi:hypothetical protein